jgi:AraC-like DNA-binding protein
MDDLIIHLDRQPRRHPAALPVAHVGFLAAKRYRVRHGFRSCNFSVILAGRGDYRWQGRAIEVRAPCVLTQRPGQPCDYGPDGAWDEVFIHPAASAERLAAMGFMDPARPVWQIGPNQLQPLLHELRRLCAATPPDADRIDRVCERLVLESLLAAESGGSPRDAVARIRALVEADCLREHDFAALAAGEGLSFPHFRRLWRRAVGEPPERFRSRLRMALACRLLTEGGAPIQQVAAAVGFPDSLHFARRFRQLVGEPPSAYRGRYPLALPRGSESAEVP